MFQVRQLLSLPALTDGFGFCQVVSPYCREGLEAAAFTLMRLGFYIVLCSKWVIKIPLDVVLCLKWVIKIPLDVVMRRPVLISCTDRWDTLAKSIDDSFEIAVAWADEWQIQPTSRNNLCCAGCCGSSSWRSLPIGVKKEGASLNDQQLNTVLDDTGKLQSTLKKEGCGPWDPEDGSPWTSWPAWRRWFYNFESLIHEIVLSLVFTSILIWTVTV